MYLIVKQIHIVLVIISVALFQVRYWLNKVQNRQAANFYKVLPHIIDTMLLGAGLYLLISAGFPLSQTPWLMVKLIAVVIYILLGFVAMKTSGLKQWMAYFLATLTVLYIMMVAHLKNPIPMP